MSELRILRGIAFKEGGNEGERRRGRKERRKEKRKEEKESERKEESIVMMSETESCLLSYIDFHVLSGNSNGNLA